MKITLESREHHKCAKSAKTDQFCTSVDSDYHVCGEPAEYLVKVTIYQPAYGPSVRGRSVIAKYSEFVCHGCRARWVTGFGGNSNYIIESERLGGEGVK